MPASGAELFAIRLPDAARPRPVPFPYRRTDATGQQEGAARGDMHLHLGPVIRALREIHLIVVGRTMGKVKRAK
jgi:hypothetical protein